MPCWSHINTKCTVSSIIPMFEECLMMILWMSQLMGKLHLMCDFWKIKCWWNGTWVPFFSTYIRILYNKSINKGWLMNALNICKIKYSSWYITIIIGSVRIMGLNVYCIYISYWRILQISHSKAHSLINVYIPGLGCM